MVSYTVTASKLAKNGMSEFYSFCLFFVFRNAAVATVIGGFGVVARYSGLLYTLESFPHASLGLG